MGLLHRHSSTKKEKEYESWVDLHSHFLPGIDDGCKTPEETADLLSISYEQGVVGMIATPHYYPRETISQFLVRRTDAADRLQRYLAQQEKPVPLWQMGAEVAYYDSLLSAEEIERLCLGKSRYLLLELPFDRWKSNLMRDIHSLIHVYGITPIIAHLERYLDFAPTEMLEQLYEMDVLIQMNAEFIIERPKEAIRRIRKGYVQVLGSDTHNLTYRAPNLRKAVEILRREGLDQELREMNFAVFESAFRG